MPARLILSLDSEDYETPAADDAELWWARTLTRYGLTANVCLVGELARALRSRGRKDVLEAYAAHEIAYHSDLHSAHPTHAEYLEDLDWDTGVARLLIEESRGLDDVREVTGQQPIAYCKPGNSWGPQVAAALPRLGCPVFCDAPFEWAPGQPMWYSGSLCVRYHLSIDYYFSQGAGWVERLQADLQRLLATHDDGYVVLYTHPCRLYMSAFAGNFMAGKNPPRSQWRSAPLRPEPEREALKADCESLLRWIARELRPPLSTYRELWDAHAPGPAPWFSRDAVRDLARGVQPVPAPLPWGKAWLSPAEQWSVLVGAVAQGEVHLTWPKQVGVRRLLGPIELPPPAPEPFEAPIGLLMAAARRALAVVEETGRMPARVPLLNTEIGPNTLLQACLRAFPRHFRARWPERVQVLPADETPALARREDFARLRYHGTWSAFPPDFRGERLLTLARLQAWTAKPALPSLEAELASS
jgi:hypothetical protein